MRKSIYIFLLISAFVRAQHITLPQINTSANTWLTNLGTIPAPLVIYAINNFIAFETANGNWPLYDRLWIVGQDNQTNSGVSIINPTSTAITKVNSPTWTAYKGWISDGSSTYINLNYIPSSAGVNFTLNSASYGCYMYTNPSSSLSNAMGSSDASVTQADYFYPYRTASNGAAYINSGNGQIFTNITTPGLFQIIRPNATTSAVYQNGSLIVSGAANTNIISPFTLFGLGLNFNGGAIRLMPAYEPMYFVASGAISITGQNNNINILATAMGWHY